MPGQDVVVQARQLYGDSETPPTWAWAEEGDPNVDVDDSAHERTLRWAAPGTYLVEATGTIVGLGEQTSGVVIHVVDDDLGRLGDVNGDGDLTFVDVELLEGRQDTGATLPPDYFERGDVDLDGRITLTDVEWIVQAIEFGNEAPIIVEPSEGSFGTRVLVVHPELLDPSAVVTARIGTSEAPMLRVRPGYATIVVPPELQVAESSSLSLSIGPRTVYTTSFDVLAPPTASDVPGEQLLDVLGRIDTALAPLDDLVDDALVSLDATDEERTTIRALLQVSHNSYAAHLAAFEDAFGMMEADGRATFEQIALANGLAALDAQLADIETRLEALASADKFDVSPANSQRLIDIVCVARDIADVAGAIAEINAVAADVIDTIDFFPVNRLPIVGQVISFLSGLSTAISTITDIIDIAAEFIPEFGPVELRASTTTPSLGESATLRTTVDLEILSGLCDRLAGDAIEGLVERMQEALIRRLASLVPGVGSAYQAARFDRDELGTVTGLLIDGISEIAGSILDAVGVPGALESLAEKLCAFIGGADPTLILRPAYDNSCGADGDTVTCTEACLGTITARASDELCGDPVAESVAITCACESTCDDEGARTCDGDTIMVCTEVAADCLQLRDVGECAAPSMCVDGFCVGGGVTCGPLSCPGCCDGGTCLAFGDQSDSTCGNGGEVCGACTGVGVSCIDGACTEGGGGACSCGSGASFEVVSGCDGWDDATECSGFRSAYCFREGADPEDPLCASIPEPDPAFQSTEFDDGTEFSAFDCTIRLSCP